MTNKEYYQELLNENGLSIVESICYLSWVQSNVDECLIEQINYSFNWDSDFTDTNEHIIFCTIIDNLVIRELNNMYELFKRNIIYKSRNTLNNFLPRGLNQKLITESIERLKEKGIVKKSTTSVSSAILLKSWNITF